MQELILEEKTTLSPVMKEIYRRLRTNLEFTGIENKVICLTSCMENDGKSNEEWESYCLIQKFRDNDVQIYENNQRIYIELLQTNINKAYQELGNKRYNALTQEMVDVSFEIFKNSGNANKNSFSMWFEGMWHRYKDMQDINIEITEKSLMDFKEKLSRLCDDYKKNDCPIALMHTIKFIEIIKEILLGNATEE